LFEGLRQGREAVADDSRDLKRATASTIVMEASSPPDST
jgi:hypothetical protein